MELLIDEDFELDTAEDDALVDDSALELAVDLQTGVWY